MYIGKENLHPNISHLVKQKRSMDEWSKAGQNQHNTKKYSERQDWRKRIMYPSCKQKQIDDKLDKMLNSQKSIKECMRTTLSEEKMVNSFVSSANYTLQKYFQSNKTSKEKDQSSLKKQLLQIYQLLHKAFSLKIQIVESFTQEQLALLIKSQLQGLIPLQKRQR